MEGPAAIRALLAAVTGMHGRVNSVPRNRMSDTSLKPPADLQKSEVRRFLTVVLPEALMLTASTRPLGMTSSAGPNGGIAMHGGHLSRKVGAKNMRYELWANKRWTSQ